MSSRWARVVRGLLAALVATFVAALFHVVGGGNVPSPLAATLGLALSTLACIALAGKALGFWRLAASVVVSQLVFHAMFSLSGSGDGSGTAMGGSEHLHPGAHLDIVPGVSASPMGDMSGMSNDSALMWASHAAAAVVTIVALRFGERAFWALWEFTALGVRRILRPVVAIAVHGVSGAPIASRPLTLTTAATMLGSMRHRGPPAGTIPLW